VREAALNFHRQTRVQRGRYARRDSRLCRVQFVTAVLAIFAFLGSPTSHAVEVGDLYRAETIVTGREAP
jgi:hypothetical protein